jgi:mono/diheme cytochrome c family protein
VISKNGIFHGRNLLTPETECVTCHGADLNGDPPAPSCISCHGALWLFKGEPHTKIKDGVPHGKKLKKPEDSCVDCHGDDLLGSPVAPSCLNCHGAFWDKNANNNDTALDNPGDIGQPVTEESGNGPVNINEDIELLLSEVPHDKFNGGVGHAQDLKNAREACIGCHGTDLQGSLTPLTPSCYACHGEKWK